MFEHYTERAKRAVFFARYEAGQTGSRAIETEHLLIGLIREANRLSTSVFAQNDISLDAVRGEIQKHVPTREKVPTFVEIPFSIDSHRVLRVAAEEAARLTHSFIGTEHLLWGILADADSLAARLLIDKGIQPGAVQAQLIMLDRTG